MLICKDHLTKVIVFKSAFSDSFNLHNVYTLLLIMLSASDMPSSCKPIIAEMAEDNRGLAQKRVRRCGKLHGREVSSRVGNVNQRFTPIEQILLCFESNADR